MAFLAYMLWTWQDAWTMGSPRAARYSIVIYIPRTSWDLRACSAIQPQCQDLADTPLDNLSPLLTWWQLASEPLWGR